MKLRSFVRPLAFAVVALGTLGGAATARAQTQPAIFEQLPFEHVDERLCPRDFAGSGSYVCVGQFGPNQVGDSFVTGVVMLLDAGASNVQGRTTFTVPAGVTISEAGIGPAPLMDGNCVIAEGARAGSGGTVVCTLATLQGPAQGIIGLRGRVNLPVGQSREIGIRHRAAVIFDRTVTVTGAGVAQ